jgi:hypothetical protein
MLAPDPVVSRIFTNKITTLVVAAYCNGDVLSASGTLET